MTDKNIEEKAREYVYQKIEENGYRNFHGVDCVGVAYQSGYNRAVKDQQDILTQYKEALRELVELAPVVIDPSVAETYFEALEFRRKFILASEKAKQLLTSK